MTRHLHQTAAALASLMILLTALSSGQDSSSIQKPVSEVKGVVADATGAVIPQSQVEFKGESGTIVAQTGMDGVVAVQLRTGKYAVTIARTGFKTEKLVDFQVEAPTPAVFRIVLQVASTSTDGGESPGVPTTTSDLPSTITLDSSRGVQESNPTSDCKTNHFVMHKTPCLCGKVQIASGDIGVSPTQMGLDDRVDVELRDKNGMLLESQRLIYRSEVPFCFSGKPKGKYALAFVLYESGKRRPAAVFPTKYTPNSNKECNVIYLIPPTCAN